MKFEKLSKSIHRRPGGPFCKRLQLQSFQCEFNTPFRLQPAIVNGDYQELEQRLDSGTQINRGVFFGPNRRNKVVHHVLVSWCPWEINSTLRNTVKWLSSVRSNPSHVGFPITTKADYLTSHLFDCKSTVPKMTFSTLFPPTHSIQAPFKESIKSLVRVVCVSLLMMFYEGLELRKELLNRI